MSLLKRLSISVLAGVEIAISLAALAFMFIVKQPLTELQVSLGIFTGLPSYIIYGLIFLIAVVLFLIGGKTLFMVFVARQKTITGKEKSLLDKLIYIGLPLFIFEFLLFYSFYLAPIFKILDSIQ